MPQLEVPELFNLVEEAIATYDDKRLTVDSHTDDFLKAHRRIITDPDDIVFLRQALYGCMRYKKMCKVVLSAFFYNHSGEALRSDSNLYWIICYIAVIRLPDMGFNTFKNMCDQLDYQKMYWFLNFLFSEEKLQKWIRDEWCKLYDPNYVEQKMIGGLLSWDDMPDYIDVLREKTTGVKSKKKKKKTDEEGYEGDGDAATEAAEEKKYTVPEPFNLTKPRPRLVPDPKAIPNTFKAEPVPPTTYTSNNKVVRKLEELRLKARKEQADRYADPKKQPFKLKTAQRPANLPKLKQKAEEDFQEKHQYIPPKVNKIPDFIKDNEATVKLNQAAVLREDFLFRKKQEKEIQCLKNYETELRDDSEFYEWQQRMKEKDEELRMEEVERRRVEMAMAAEDALEARQKQFEFNHAIATGMREEKKIIEQKMHEEKQEVEAHNKVLVHEIKESHEGARIAKKAVLDDKVQRAIELKVEKEELEKKRREEAKLEQDRKDDLIRQIRALENVPVKKEVVFDPTEVVQHGLLEEMSLAELKERIQVVRTRAKEQEEYKRLEIVRERQEKEEELVSKVENLAKLRQIAARENRDSRKKRIEQEKAKEKKLKEIREKHAVELNSILEKRRKERIEEAKALAKVNKETKIKQQFLGAAAAQIEETKWKDMERGASREAKERQHVTQSEDADKKQLKKQFNTIRTENIKAERLATKIFREDYDRRLTATKKETHMMITMENEAKRKDVEDEKLLHHRRAVQASKTPLAVYTRNFDELTQERATRKAMRESKLNGGTNMDTTYNTTPVVEDPIEETSAEKENVLPVESAA